jgi:hypothetical protein
MASSTTSETNWHGTPVSITARLVPRYAWQSASIDVAIRGRVVLRSGGVFKLVGKHAETFASDGIEHRVEVTWGKAALRSFPFSLSIDGMAVVESRVPIANWWLALWPWALFVGYIAWRFSS